MASDNQEIIMSLDTGQSHKILASFPRSPESNNLNNYIVYKTKKHDQLFSVHSSSRMSDCNRCGQLHALVFLSVPHTNS